MPGLPQTGATGTAPQGGFPTAGEGPVAEKTGSLYRELIDPCPLPLPDALHAVVAKNRVGGDDREFFLDGLRHQQTVKGVAVMRGQRFHSPNMRHPNVRHAEAVGADMFDDVAPHRDGEFQLALYLLGRDGDAVAALAEVKKHAPRIAKLLTAKKPRMPELHAGVTTLGGEDEAWYYRQSWRGVWERTGALDWLRQVAGGKA